MNRADAVLAYAPVLAGLTPYFDDVVVWPAARLRMRIYEWPADPPPDALITSGRAVVFRRSQVVVVRQHDGVRHVVPGGRREEGETLEETIRREVLEECGWRVEGLSPFALLYFQTLEADPARQPQGLGDFAHIVCVAEGRSHDRRALDRTQIEAGARLSSVAAARAGLSAGYLAMLDGALAARRRFRINPCPWP